MRRIIIFVLIFAYCYFLFLSLRSVLWGGIPFWSDPARDLLLAWDNLHKISLIGPPGGIPGVFYGPYWLWILSLIQYVSLDPRVVTLTALLIPYFILSSDLPIRSAPFIFMRVSSNFTFKVT